MLLYIGVEVTLVGLTVVCWLLNNKRLNRLHRTDGVHTLINLVQMAFVCLHLLRHRRPDARG